jgi:hypothetical protein
MFDIPAMIEVGLGKKQELISQITRVKRARDVTEEVKCLPARVKT